MSSGLHNLLSTSITPFGGGISLLEGGDGLSIDKFPVLSLDRAIEFALVGSYWNM